MGKKEIMRLGISLLFCSLFAILFTECTQKESIKEPNYSLQSSEKKPTSVNYALSRESAKNLLKDILVKFPSEEYAQGMRGSSSPIIGESFGYATNSFHKRFRNGEEITDSLYIFNFANGEGFAIMSDDARLEPLLAISFSGNLQEKDFTRKDSDSPFYAYLKALAANYTQMKAGKVEPGGFPKDGDIREVHQSIIKVYDMPYGHCRAKWAPYAPFNMYCPVVNGGHAWAGCVPVACAQLMSIYKTPTHYKSYTFDWNQMLPVNFSSAEESEPVKQVAFLIKELGISLHTTYSPDENRGTTLSFIPETLNNFGYSFFGSITEKYTSDVAIQELRNGYPLLIAGGTKKDGTNFGDERDYWYHMWLVDGLLSHQLITTKYNTENGQQIDQIVRTPRFYLKCNWGLGGLYNGYYSVSSFDITRKPTYNDDQQSGKELRDSSEGVYNHNLKIIRGIRPKK